MTKIDALLDAAEAVRWDWLSGASAEVQAMIDARLAEGWHLRMVICATTAARIQLELLAPNGYLAVPLDSYLMPTVAAQALN